MDPRRASRLALLVLCAIVSSPSTGRGQESAATPAEDAPGPLTLRAALAAALSGSPDLAVFSLALRAREGDVLQAGLLPNPELTTEVEDFAGSGDRSAFEQTQATVSIAQLIELGGKRARRLRLAALDRDLAAWDYEVARLDVISSVSRAFTAVLAGQQRARLFGELARVARRSADEVSAQVRAGATSPLELLRAEAALGQTEVDQCRAERDLAIARSALSATWGSPTPAFAEAAGDLTALAPPPPLAAILDAVRRNPDVARWTTEVERRAAALAVEKARAIPSLTVGVGGRQFTDNGDTAMIASFSLPLPLFNRNQGNIAAADQQRALAVAARERAAVGVKQALSTAHADLSAAYDQATILRDQVLPKAESAFTGARDAYQRGLLRFLDVLDAQRTLFGLRDRYLEALADYHGALANVQRLSGLALDTTVELSASDSDAHRSRAVQRGARGQTEKLELSASDSDAHRSRAVQRGARGQTEKLELSASDSDAHRSRAVQRGARGQTQEEDGK
jgi:cobalt-zinc-cadmium efflux system outer membrane protein